MKRSVKKLRNLCLSIIGVSMFVSCSNNTDESQTNDKIAKETLEGVDPSLAKDGDENIDPVLQELYAEMLRSESYIRFAAATKAFAEKLGDEIPDSETSSGEKLLNWISGNISKTQFLDFNEASNEYQNLLNLSSAETQQNLGLYNYLGGTRPGTLLPVITPPQPEPSTCPNCTKQYKACTSSADTTYANEVESASSQYTSGQINNYDFSMAKAGARLDWEKAYKKCTTSYNLCCIGG